MDETGQHGGATPGKSGNEAGQHDDQSRPDSGWAAADGSWSNAGAALDPGPEPVIPQWRQPAEPSTVRGWAEPSSRYPGLLSPLSPATSARETGPRNGVSFGDQRSGESFGDRRSGESAPVALQVPASAPPYPYEGDLEDAESGRLAVPAVRPGSAPPAPADPAGTRAGAEPEASGDAAESARHARDEPTEPDGTSAADPPWRDSAQTETHPTRPGRAERPPPWRDSAQADPPPWLESPPAAPPPSRALGGSPGWSPKQPAETPPTYQTAPVQSSYRNTSGYPTYPRPPLGEPSPATVPRPAEPASEMLPQRVPGEPDVPIVPEPPAVEPHAETPELARIATHLRREDVPPQYRERPEGFDVKAILAAVRGVAGVRDASLRTTPAGAHSLRLDLADGADPADVSRQVARLLQERMGLAAAPRNLQPEGPAEAEQAAGGPYLPTQSAGGPYLPTQSQPGGGGAGQAEPLPDVARRRRYASPARGRANVEDAAGSAGTGSAGTGSAPIKAPGFPPPGAVGTAGGTPVAAASTYPRVASAADPAPPRPLDRRADPGAPVIIDHVQVSTFGLDATVEVRLVAGEHNAVGLANGPAVDGYVLRLCAVAAASAVDDLLRTARRADDHGRCFVEHAAVVPFGSSEVAVVVVLLVCGGWVEQLAGSALVAGDPRQAVVRATLAAVNRRLEAMLS